VKQVTNGVADICIRYFVATKERSEGVAFTDKVEL